MTDDWSDIPELREYPLNGEEVRRLRRKKRMSREALGLEVGVSGRMIRNYELSKNRILREKFPKLVAALGVKPYEILAESLMGEIRRYQPGMPVVLPNEPSVSFEVTIKISGTGLESSVHALLSNVRLLYTHILDNLNIAVTTGIQSFHVTGKNVLTLIIEGALENGNFVIINVGINITDYPLFFQLIVTNKFDIYRHLIHTGNSSSVLAHICGEVYESVETAQLVSNGRLLQGEEWKRFFDGIHIKNYEKSLPESKIIMESLNMMYNDFT